MGAMHLAAQDGGGAVALSPECYGQFSARLSGATASSAPSEDESPTFYQNDEAAAAKQLIETIDSLPNISWLNGDTPDYDRELLSQRFA